jgi:hypothetical protein
MEVDLVKGTGGRVNYTDPLDQFFSARKVSHEMGHMDGGNPDCAWAFAGLEYRAGLPAWVCG